MTTIVERDRSLVDIFQGAVGAEASVVANIDELRRRLDGDSAEFAVVLGPSVDVEAAAALATSLRVSRPAMSVILVRKRVDTGLLVEALRAGVREVVEDRDLTGLGQAVRRAHDMWTEIRLTENPTGPVSDGKLITVFSTKGGVGKSTLATNLSAALVDEGGVRVCLVDLDLSSGDVALMLQQFPEHSIADALALQHDLDPAGLRSLLTPHSDGLVTLAAPTAPDVREHIPVELVEQVLRMLKTMFDFVVVDAAPAFDEFVMQAFDVSDLVILIGTLDMPALKAFKVAVDTLELLNLPRERWRVVLNRADSKVGLTSADVEKTLGMAITAAIPSSRDVSTCVNHGDLIVRSDSRHSVSRSIRELARHCLGHVQPSHAHAAVAAVAAEAAPRRRGGWLRRKAVRSQ